MATSSSCQLPSVLLFSSRRRLFSGPIHFTPNNRAIKEVLCAFYNQIMCVGIMQIANVCRSSSISRGGKWGRRESKNRTEEGESQPPPHRQENRIDNPIVH